MAARLGWRGWRKLKPASQYRKAGGLPSSLKVGGLGFPGLPERGSVEVRQKLAVGINGFGVERLTKAANLG